jgi:2-methylcitrate dehydratase PrpD
MYTDPKDGLQAKFSLEYGAALVLVAGRAALSDFTDAAAMRPEIRALYPRIHRHPVDKAEGEFPTEIEIALKDGRCFVHKAAMPMGSIAAPFPTSQYWVKFENCTGELMELARAAALRAALEALPDLPTISPLTAPLAPPLSAPLS